MSTAGVPFHRDLSGHSARSSERAAYRTQPVSRVGPGIPPSQFDMDQNAAARHGSRELLLALIGYAKRHHPNSDLARLEP